MQGHPQAKAIYILVPYCDLTVLIVKLFQAF